jgi:hypothetical protein
MGSPSLENLESITKKEEPSTICRRLGAIDALSTSTSLRLAWTPDTSSERAYARTYSDSCAEARRSMWQTTLSGIDPACLSRVILRSGGAAASATVDPTSMGIPICSLRKKSPDRVDAATELPPCDPRALCLGVDRCEEGGDKGC